tara:strand:+ start:1225 stop:1554 length:330 start_codon:yes stop_codon:yes gene_type:complete
MKNYIFSLFILVSYTLISQNLVPNPGFEDIIECPYAYPGNTEIHFAEPWIPVRTIENSTSDLLHECVFEPGNDPWRQLEFYGDEFLENRAHSGLSRARIGLFRPYSYNR